MTTAEFEHTRSSQKLSRISLVLALGLFLSQLTSAQTEKVLHSFGSNQDGIFPYSNLVRYRGNFYGTTILGGAYNAGTVFEITSKGIETVLHSFDNTDGGSPGSLIVDKEGNLYGTTQGGGSASMGVVFKVTPTGVESTLYNFTGGSDGEFPSGPLALDRHGNLFGVAEGGNGRYGLVFKLSPSGTESVVYDFTGGADGGEPNGGLVLDSEGNIYGTTQEGGANSGCSGFVGCGVVFEISPSGTERVLHSFANNGVDAYNPPDGLVRDKLGNLYGTSWYGGQTGWGALFEMSSTGTETVLASFSHSVVYRPNGPLIIDKLGNLYGTTVYNGSDGCGSVFEYVPTSQQLMVLYDFSGSPNDGCWPYAGLSFGAKGRLYGTTSSGGDYGNGYGTVFVVTP